MDTVIRKWGNSPAIYNIHASCQSENLTLIDDQLDI
jgi:antitoxin component of MazEF toxin-antitoxin module